MLQKLLVRHLKDKMKRIIEVKNLYFGYEKNLVLEDVNLDIFEKDLENGWKIFVVLLTRLGNSRYKGVSNGKTYG